MKGDRARGLPAVAVPQRTSGEATAGLTAEPSDAAGKDTEVVPAKPTHELMCACESLTQARWRWHIELDEALQLRADTRAGLIRRSVAELPERSSMTTKVNDVLHRMARRAKILPPAAPLPPPLRATASEEGSMAEQQSRPLSYIAELLARLLVTCCYGFSFFLQFLCYTAIGPSFDSVPSLVIAEFLTDLFSTFSCLVLTSFTFRNSLWVAGLFFAVQACALLRMCLRLPRGTTPAAHHVPLLFAPLAHLALLLSPSSCRRWLGRASSSRTACIWSKARMSWAMQHTNRLRASLALASEAPPSPALSVSRAGSLAEGRVGSLPVRNLSY